MVLERCKKNVIYKEFNDADRIKYFDLTSNKVLPRIDTIVINVYLDDYDSTLSRRFVSFLDDCKELASSCKKRYYIDAFGCYCLGSGISMYPYILSKLNNDTQSEEFKIMFMKTQFNLDAPPCQVIFSSQYLWSVGYEVAMESAIDFLSYILDGICIVDTSISRVDYAFHTNYIKDIDNYFSSLNERQVSRFNCFQKWGTFEGSGKDKTNMVSFGKRSGKNVYLRIYDKTEEIISSGKKPFFFEVWYANKMISLYDKFVYEDTFKSGKSFSYTYISRLKFYLEFGSDDDLKKECRFYIENIGKLNFDKIIDFANSITPKITAIVNVEYETRRKFYHSIADFMTRMECNRLGVLKECFLVLDNCDVIINYLTSTTFRLVKRDGNKLKKDCDYDAFWKILRKASLDCKKYDSVIRVYSHNFDIHKCILDISKKLSNLSLLRYGQNEDSLISDLVLFHDMVWYELEVNVLAYKKSRFYDYRRFFPEKESCGIDHNRRRSAYSDSSYQCSFFDDSSIVGVMSLNYELEQALNRVSELEGELQDCYRLRRLLHPNESLEDFVSSGYTVKASLDHLGWLFNNDPCLMDYIYDYLQDFYSSYREESYVHMMFNLHDYYASIGECRKVITGEYETLHDKKSTVRFGRLCKENEYKSKFVIKSKW
ncbi:hypothetical protein AN639_02130 [Candidatus Epulonipiscium fishelsonii]|uniref:Uncharacterized protein n=1 Tax=Candidatus Epulonipiscium fishelsonii TaxID=77094 RepID=A0ACC8XFF4_9FIRM|nr:hypothetical protein AN396_02285 [Epulopiscium sp. SCG-B11WGA-EpuloA1]ONI43419.1 hypothetical protein AN639_02130 [Epulopiscium sp. SCG-B05WGA-EpuloA1]ONI48378.1 hypothetical protein AN643_01690 [Epulopiscium sp. SCG-B10WGA-EpuloB]